MVVYKLFRRRKDGSLGPLFINTRQRINIGEWLHAESHPTKGYAVRPGWHACLKAEAPHLKKEPKGHVRVWVKCEVEDYETYARPKNQGGIWVLAQRLRVIEIIG